MNAVVQPRRFNEDRRGEEPAEDTVVAAPRTLGERLRLPLMILGPVALLAVAGTFYLFGGRYEDTDDAYVRAGQVSISSNVAGRVTELLVHDNQVVHKGDVLFRLDDAPLRIAVAEAQAQLGKQRLQVESLKATYRQRQADLAAARDTLAYRQTEFERQQRLLDKGIASRSQFDAASHARESAQQQLSSAQQQIAAALAGLDGDPNIPLEKHPLVMEAQAQLDHAQLNLSYAAVAAPSEGVVTRVEQLQVGTFIAAAQPVFALVSKSNVWVEANFKEVQLAHMRPGQAAKVTIDALPGRRFTAHVTSVSPGTGSEFSMLPAENATGNWVKVVQRVPVRLEIEGLDDAALLQSGLSARVEVDTQYQRHLFGRS
ncbi:MAG TPA: HlyD family secretion protein [Povalibacter sp.]|nr:HlyD family secretion protein [Povalibacter sp.]